SSNAHTYRLLIFKDQNSVLHHLLFASNRFVRQQQRKESMKCFSFFVNPSFRFVAVFTVDFIALTV
ncbi:hypothetical protein, partial [Massilia timonae]|uniref:hypothetical protein n=1 Tax=Massilia timonae TaxID=47229 RepID=UPI0028D600E6